MGTFLGRLLRFSHFGGGGTIHYRDLPVSTKDAEDVLTDFIVARIHRLAAISADLRRGPILSRSRLFYYSRVIDSEVDMLQALVDGIERVAPLVYDDGPAL